MGIGKLCRDVKFEISIVINFFIAKFDQKSTALIKRKESF